MISLRQVLVPAQFVYGLVKILYLAVVNQRNVFQLAGNFAINFSLIFTWLLIFKNAGIIPNSWRPPIHVKLLPNIEKFIYDLKSLNGWVSMLILGTLAYMVADFFYLPKLRQSDVEYDLIDNSLLLSSSSDDFELSSMDSDSNSATSADPTNKDSLEFINNSRISKPLTKIKKSRLAPPVLLLCSWFILNFVHYLSPHQTTFLDITAWISYVLCHLLAPIITLVWLYLFHEPGCLKWFALTLGIQNICGVTTHLLFPNALPWFIHMYGEDSDLNYEMLGYAAGLVRVDIALGTHLNSNGFHKSPIVFGAFPSLHSAMAVLVFFTLSYHARWNLPTIMGGLFVTIQWWATIYLDHHWRIDLFAGSMYALIFFTLFKSKLQKCEEKFIHARVMGDFLNSSTVGMRVFKNTRLQNFFDPLPSKNHE